MQQTEAEMRDLVARLHPGDRVDIEHTVIVGIQRWTTTSSGTVVATERCRHGLHFRRSGDDGVWSDVIVIERDDGERTALTVDEFTRVRRHEPAAGGDRQV